MAAAYSHGTEWLDQVIAYIQGNIDYTEHYLKEQIPTIKMIRPQASYLIFMDCRALGLNQEELNRLFVEGAHLALNDGTTFGKEGIYAVERCLSACYAGKSIETVGAGCNGFKIVF